MSSGDKSKLDAIESNATADQTASEIRTLVESASDSNVFTDADHTKLNGIESNATADQTAAEIRTLVESASDSNVFTDADHTKLDGIATGAEVNVNPTISYVGGILTMSPGGDTATIPSATTSSKGLFTAVQATKLDGIATSANNYSHPNHSGDVTSSGDGATTIANDAVTYAKMQDLGTANRVLGGTSAGTIAEVQVATAMIADNAVTEAKLEHDVVLPGTGAVTVPIGNTNARPTGVEGMFRYNSETDEFEGFADNAWGAIGGAGGATGGGTDQIFYENGTTVATDYTVGTTFGNTGACNAMSAGPITVNNGVTVTVNSGSRWVIV